MVNARSSLSLSLSLYLKRFFKFEITLTSELNYLSLSLNSTTQSHIHNQNHLTMSIPGTVHSYLPKKTAFEFNGTNPQHFAKNVVLFIGGLTDGLLTVHYLPQLAKTINSIDHHGDWVLIQGLLSSSYMGWGHGSLETDNKEISKIISYLRSPQGGSRQKIILMGHSTGCQDAIRYLSQFRYQDRFIDSMDIDGAILQAPVSDREGVAEEMGPEHLDSLVKECYDNYISKGLLHELLPLKFTKASFNYPINAYRFYSLYLKYGDDDFFSTYLSNDLLSKSFGKVEKPLLVLYGEKDEYALESVDKQQLIQKWSTFVPGSFWCKESKVLKNANHTVDDVGAMNDMIETISRFIYCI